jgi:hypothetical protein
MACTIQINCQPPGARKHHKTLCHGTLWYLNTLRKKIRPGKGRRAVILYARCIFNIFKESKGISLPLPFLPQDTQ